MDVSEISKSLRAVLYERSRSPFYGSFVISWLVWNWKFLYYIFINDGKNSVANDIHFISSNYVSTCDWIIYPLAISIIVFSFGTLFTLIFLFIKQLADKIRRKYIEEKELLTKEESNRIRRELAEEEQRIRTRNVDILNELDSTRKRLQDTINSNELLRADNVKLEKTLSTASEEIKVSNEPSIDKAYDKNMNNLNDIPNDELLNSKEENENDGVYSIESRLVDLSGGKYEVTIADYLNNLEGTITLWAKATNRHIVPKAKGASYQYILGVSPNEGQPIDEKGSRYINAWGIGRKIGILKDVSWRFWATNQAGDNVTIEDFRPINEGWFMISLTWSKSKDFIKMYVNEKKVGEKNMTIWPSEVKDVMYIGTWPNRAQSHFFGSKVGAINFYNKALGDSRIRSIYSKEKILVEKE